MKKTAYILLIIVYIIFAPIYAKVFYYEDNDLEYPKFQSSAYLWVKTKSDFKYFLLGGIYDTQLAGKSMLVFRTQTKSYASIKITDAEIMSQNKWVKIDEIIGKTYKLDKTEFNRYAGSGATGTVEFKWPISELRDIEVKITMMLIDNKGSSHNLVFNRKLSYIQKSAFSTMLNYVLTRSRAT